MSKLKCHDCDVEFVKVAVICSDGVVRCNECASAWGTEITPE